MGATGESVRRLTSFGNSTGLVAGRPRARLRHGALREPVRPHGHERVWAVELRPAARRASSRATSTPSSPRSRRTACASPTGRSPRRPPARHLDDAVQGARRGRTAACRSRRTRHGLVIPVWAPDGKSLYFLSNRNGAMNLWRVPIDEATGKSARARRGRAPARARGRRVRALARRPPRRLRDQRNTFAFDRLRFDPPGPARAAGPSRSRRARRRCRIFDVSPDGIVFAFDSRGGARTISSWSQSTARTFVSSPTTRPRPSPRVSPRTASASRSTPTGAAATRSGRSRSTAAV